MTPAQREALADMLVRRENIPATVAYYTTFAGKHLDPGLLLVTFTGIGTNMIQPDGSVHRLTTHSPRGGQSPR